MKLYNMCVCVYKYVYIISKGNEQDIEEISKPLCEFCCSLQHYSQ